jgi:hypothetical protein
MRWHSVRWLSRGWRFVRILVLVFLSTSTGCAHLFEVESMWDVPYPPGERPSPLWTSDPRTSGWKGVEVTYYLLGNENVDAEVRPADQRSQFTVRGKYWCENEKHEKCDAYPDGVFLVVDFDGKKERYRFGTAPDRAIITVEQNAPESTSP